MQIPFNSICFELLAAFNGPKLGILGPKSGIWGFKSGINVPILGCMVPIGKSLSAECG